MATTKTRAQLAGFDIQLRVFTEDAYKRVFPHPEKLRMLLGEALDKFMIEEEIDYTLEVKRVHDYLGTLNKPAAAGRDAHGKR
jgi:hypothetical protein